MERDSVICPVKLETTTDLETVDNECLSCDLGSVSEAQFVPHFNDGQEDPKTYQYTESPSDNMFSSSDLVPLTAAHSEDVPSQSYQGGSSSAEPVVESPSDNFGQEHVDMSPFRSKDKSTRIMYQCDDRLYQIKKLHHFKEHRMIHTGEKSHSCDQCSYKAAYMSVLMRLEHVDNFTIPDSLAVRAIQNEPFRTEDPCPEFKVGTTNQAFNQFLKQGLHIF